jgi:CIC family chloride channel protein
VVGIVGGTGAILFRHLISFVKNFFFNILLPVISYEIYGFNMGLILLPAIGGLIVGPIIFKYAKETKGHGVPEVIEAVHLRGGVIRPRVAFVKILVSSITIGSGGSAGREGPIVQIGSTIGSFLGKFFLKTKKNIRLMVACGAAAGISATFNAPLGGTIFAIEIISTHSGLISAIPILLSAIVGDVVMAKFSGLGPVFEVPSYTFTTLNEIPFFITAGMALGIVAILWSRTFYKIEGFFEQLKLPGKFKLVIGGFLVGVIGMFLFGYGIMGVGYEGINLAMLGKLSIGMLIILGLAKIVATSLTIGSGGSGGIFAPSLFIGSMFGTAFGLFANSLFPNIVTQPLAYSLIGMGAVFAGACRAPITTLIMIPEMTNNYQLLIPMMIVVTLSYIISSLGTKDSMYLLKLIKRGVKIHKKENILEDVLVKDVMRTNVVTVNPAMSAASVADLMLQEKHPAFPVVTNTKNNEKKYLGFIRIYEFKHIKTLKRKGQQVMDFMSKEYPCVSPEDSVYHALNVMTRHNYGRIPVVVKKGKSKYLAGIISKTDVIRAYEMLI